MFRAVFVEPIGGEQDRSAQRTIFRCARLVIVRVRIDDDFGKRRIDRHIRRDVTTDVIARIGIVTTVATNVGTDVGTDIGLTA